MGLAIDGDGEPIIGRWPLRRRRSSDGEFKFDLTPKATASDAQTSSVLLRRYLRPQMAA
jgi:hypothetical protein